MSKQASPEQLKKAAAKLERQLAQLKKLTGGQTSDAARQQANRAAARELTIPDVKEPNRRADKAQDDAEWLRFYVPSVFYNPFTPDQLATIEQCGHALKYGVQKCKAMPRGDGKSSILKYLMMKYALERQVMFPVVIAATFKKAQQTTKDLKEKLASKKPSPLAEDYPLECLTAQYVDPWPSRARNVIANGGRPIHVSWGSAEGHFVIPTWEDEEPIGPIVGSIGWTSDDLQGCNVHDRRPDFVMIDDLDSRDSLAAEHGVIAEKIEECIDKTIAGLGGQSKSFGQFMICTITSDIAAAFKYSDLESKPTWDGERVKAIQEWPRRMDLWDRYIHLYQAGPHEGDKFCRKAHSFYLDNQKEMDDGAVVCNPYNYDRTELPDGSEKEASNLERCFVAIAKTSREAFDTEYQNDPPRRADILETKVTPYHVANTAGELNRLDALETTNMVVAGIDVRKIELHDMRMASDGETPHRVVDYNIRSHGTTETTVAQAEDLIYRALHHLIAGWEHEAIRDENGTVHSTDLTLIDKGWVGNWTEDGTVKTWATQPVETFCMEMGLRNFLPAKGQPNYKAPTPSDKCIVGDNWHMNRGEGAERSCTEVIWNTNHWHLLVEELFMLAAGEEDKFSLFAAADGIWTNHKAVGEHITVGATELKNTLTKGTRSRKPRFIRDHWWDCAAMMLAARSVELWFRANLKPRKRPKRGARRKTSHQEIGAR